MSRCGCVLCLLGDCRTLVERGHVGPASRLLGELGDAIAAAIASAHARGRGQGIAEGLEASRQRPARKAPGKRSAARPHSDTGQGRQALQGRQGAIAVSDLPAWLLVAGLTDVLERTISGRTKAHELVRLLPWTWKAERLGACH